MSLDLWTAVEQYVDGLQIAPDPVMDEVLAASAAAGLPMIAVSPSQGKLLCLLAQICGAKRILEIGTLGGYSTIWLARALPKDGRLITLELEKKHYETARANLARAGLSALVEQRLGPARELLDALVAEGAEPFDFVFIDADKDSYAEYFAGAMKLSRAGTVMVLDNVIRDGEVADAETKDPRVMGVRRLNEALAAETRATATTMQTVGSKGYDGFTLVRVTG